MPWRDPAGRFSPFKLAVFLLLFVPAILIAVRYVNGALGARPVNEAIHQSGNWCLTLILASLAITPGRVLLRWPRLQFVRRMVGVAAFFYAVLHLGLYVLDEAFDLRKVALEIVLRIYLLIGFVSLLVLTAMAITSTDGLMRRLGGRRWRQLHRLIYGATLLGVIHFFMQSKFNVSEPWIFSALFAWLMVYRVLAWHGLPTGWIAPWWPALLAIVLAIVTALAETVFYWIKTGVDPMRVLGANIAFVGAPRPAIVALAIMLTAALAIAVRTYGPRPLAAARGPQRG